MSLKKVLVFGPTGGVGSAVFLAMRNPSKPIPGLSAEEEQKSERYERIQSDLNEPDSVRTAVLKTGATHAFIYAAIGSSPDHLRSTAEVLKAAGIKYVVLLSSYTVRGDITAIQPSHPIAYEHAQVEISLEEVFGPKRYVAVRPAFFASNSLWWAKQIVEDGEVKWAFPDLKFDFISPDDIGAVCGTILAGFVDGEQENPVFLAGPEKELSIADAIDIIGQLIKKPTKVTEISPEENVRVLVEKSGMTEMMAKVLTESFVKASENQVFLRAPLTPEMRANIENYLKRPAMRFSEWAGNNKDKFEA
ncbi:hypothetical protein BJX61DRAFT_550476 [Aspergillus egyptiacus]|nr:hypothetical protein BJX61DRAFT_550476 [Aspergillus egyptiacus]